MIRLTWKLATSLQKQISPPFDVQNFFIGVSPRADVFLLLKRISRFLRFNCNRTLQKRVNGLGFVERLSFLLPIILEHIKLYSEFANSMNAASIRQILKYIIDCKQLKSIKINLLMRRSLPFQQVEPKQLIQTIITLKQHLNRNLFIKNYQAELIFIQKEVENDISQIQGKRRCCPSFPSFKSGNSQNMEKQLHKRFAMYNPQFCTAFNKLKGKEKLIYYAQTLQYNSHLSLLIDQQVEMIRKTNRFNNLKMKKDLMTNMLQKFIPPESMAITKNDNATMVHNGFEILYGSYSTTRKNWVERTAYLSHTKMTISGQNPLQGRAKQSFKFDLRNYILRSSENRSQKIRPYVLESVFKGVQHQTIRITFKNQQDLRKYIHYISDFTKIGRIEKIIHAIDSAKFVKNLIHEEQKVINPQVQAVQAVMGVRIQIEDPLDVSNDQNFFEFQDSYHQEQHQKMKEDQREKLKNQLVKKMIDALNKLADKKNVENQKEKQFYLKKAVSNKIPQNSRIKNFLEEIKTIQNKLKIKSVPSNNELALSKNIPVSSDKLTVTIFNKRKSKELEDQAMGEVFHDMSNSLSSGHSWMNQKIKHKNKHQFSKNIFKLMFPFYDIASIQKLSNFQKVELTQQNSQGVAEPIKDLNQFCDIYRSLVAPSFRFKACFYFQVGIEVSLKHLLAVQKYPRWHSCIRSCTVLNRSPQTNSFLYELIYHNQMTGKAFKMIILRHLFQLDGQLYIAERSLVGESEKKYWMPINIEKQGINANVKIQQKQLELMIMKIVDEGASSTKLMMEVGFKDDSKDIRNKQAFADPKEHLIFLANFCNIRHFAKQNNGNFQTGFLLDPAWTIPNEFDEIKLQRPNKNFKKKKADSFEFGNVSQIQNKGNPSEEIENFPESGSIMIRQSM